MHSSLMVYISASVEYDDSYGVLANRHILVCVGGENNIFGQRLLLIIIIIIIKRGLL